jgi:transcriptional regulator with XRE-family HTH domain
MKTRFKNTADAAAHLAENPDVAPAVQQEIQRNTLVSTLLAMRIGKGLTQETIAQRMGCDPSKISRIESGNDEQLKWLDIIGYTIALQVQMSVLFDDESLPPAVRIKQCVFKIDDDLRKLALMAQEFDGDNRTAEKINEFYKEVLFNFLKRFTANQERLTNFISIPPRTQIPASKEGDPAESGEKDAPEAAHR